MKYSLYNKGIIQMKYLTILLLSSFLLNLYALDIGAAAPDFKLTSNEGVSKALKNTRDLWDKVEGNADTILESRNTVLDLHDVAGELAKTITHLQTQSEQVATQLIKIGGSANQVRLAGRQVWYAERLTGSVQKILSGKAGSKEAAASFGRNVTNFGDVVNGMLAGNHIGSMY